MSPSRKSGKSKTTIIVAVAVLVVVAAGTALIFGSMGSASTSDATYTTGEVATGTIEKSVSGSGQLAAASVTEVVPDLSGTVRNLAVKEGQTVAAGDVLFTIESDDIDTQVLSASAQLASAQDQVARAKLDLAQANASYTALASRPATSTAASAELASAQQKVSSAKVSVTSAQASLASAQSSYDKVVEQADSRTVVAPSAGVVTAVNVTEGGDTTGSSSSAASSSSAGSGQATAATTTGSSSGGSAAVVISDTSQMVATISVAEADLPLVEEGMSATVTFDALEGVESSGTVTHIATSGTASSGLVTFAVDVTVTAPDSRLRTGMNATATVILEKAEDVLVVSNAAIELASDGTATVKRVTDTDTQAFESVTVEVGLASDSYTEIKSGLSEGDVVITGTVAAETTASDSSSALGGMGGAMMGGGGPTGMPSGQRPTAPAGN